MAREALLKLDRTLELGDTSQDDFVYSFIDAVDEHSSKTAYYLEALGQRWVRWNGFGDPPTVDDHLAEGRFEHWPGRDHRARSVWEAAERARLHAEIIARIERRKAKRAG